MNVYQSTLDRCSPSVLVPEALARVEADLMKSQVNLVSLGKAAFALADATSALMNVDRTLIAAPRGYERESSLSRAEVILGGHPFPDRESFLAGKRLVDFVRESELPIVFLISGGSSACVELPLSSLITEEELISVHRLLLRAGLSIEKVNTVRKHLSAIKGGRLGVIAPVDSRTLIYSDVGTGQEVAVGSGPTLPDTTTIDQAAVILRTMGDDLCNRIADRLDVTADCQSPNGFEHAPPILIADNRTLVERATEAVLEAGWDYHRVEAQIEGDVESAAESLLREMRSIPGGTVIVSGGEPTVAVLGQGRGGRCSELALRVARLASESDGNCCGLFGSSDGVDGNTAAAGVVISFGLGHSLLPSEIESAIRQSDSFGLACQMGEAIRIPATGNNLRDLYLLARD